MTPHLFATERLDTPTGPIVIVTDAAQALRAIEWDDCDDRMQRLLTRYYGAGAFRLQPARQVTAAYRALQAYFAGEVAALDHLPTVTTGTAFQRLVWDTLRTIPAGQPISYGALALRIGRPSAVRAVGLANGANPISIVVPCHRVIGANGALTGFGGGLERKRWLLSHEDRTPGLWPAAAMADSAPVL